MNDLEAENVKLREELQDWKESAKIYKEQADAKNDLREELHKKDLEVEELVTALRILVAHHGESKTCANCKDAEALLTKIEKRKEMV